MIKIYIYIYIYIKDGKNSDNVKIISKGIK